MKKRPACSSCQATRETDSHVASRRNVTERMKRGVVASFSDHVFSTGAGGGQREALSTAGHAELVFFNDLFQARSAWPPFRAQQPQSAEAHLLRFQGGIDRSTDELRLHAMLREHAAPFSGVCP